MIKDKKTNITCKAVRKVNYIIYTGILLIILLMGGPASAATVTYYLNATGGVNIGADGITNVNGYNQNIPPTITALMDKTGLNSASARSNDHPTGLYNHSRWYFNSNYPARTQIGANPTGKAYMRGTSVNDFVIIHLFDYDPLTGSKVLIGSSPQVELNKSPSDFSYSYTILSPDYIVLRDHRLMLQFDFNQNNHESNARVYSSFTNSYLSVIENPITLNVTVNSTPSFSGIKAGESFVYSITANNTGTTDGSYSLGVIDSDIMNFLPSVPGTTTLFVPAGGSNQTTLTVTAKEGAPKDASDITTLTATSIDDPFYSSSLQTTTNVTVPVTYNVSIKSNISSAIIKAGESFVYSLSVNNTGTTDGSYSLEVMDSDTTNFSYSIPGMTTLFVPAGGSNQTTLTVTANDSAPKDAIDTTTVTVISIENPIYFNFTQTITIVGGQNLSNCAQCHESYEIAVNSSKHDQTRNPAGPNCTLCHTGYDTQHTGYVVNENNTCRICHIDGMIGFYERHSNSSDCTTCHFANTTRPFSLNASLYSHDHNLTVEHNFYEYNMSGLPVRTNGGAGEGMFPYYTCTLTCHKYNETTGVEGKIDEAAMSWFNSSHARSLHMTGDNKMSCAKCKSPANYNASANQSLLIDQPDWQGIQCRVCHNLHDRRFPNDTGPRGFPVAFYNSTLSSILGYAFYEAVPDTTVLCEKCHAGTSHDSKFAGTHKDTAGFNCTNCHMNSSFNTELHTFEVKNTTSGLTGCEVCHKAENHIFNFTSNHSGKVTCEACHDKTVARNATGYAVSSDNKSYGLYMDPLTSQVSSWKDSHGTPATWPLHNISKEVDCNKCHGAYSLYNGSVKQSTLIVNEIQCMSCHNTGQGPIDDPAKYPAIIESWITKHKNVNNSTGTDVLDSDDCKTCHYDTTNMSNVLTYSCEECHMQSSLNAPLIKNHIQDGLRINTNASCSDCHNNSISNYAYSANASVSHYETNISLIDTSNCIICHNGTYTNNASWGSPQNISTSIKRSHNETQTSQCDLCHKDRSIPSLELVTFHDAGLQSDINNCMGCHPTVTSMDMGGHSILNGTNATDNGDCRTCHTIEICQLEVGYSNKSNTYYCQDCHTDNGSGPNMSRIKWQERKHGRAECINCHIADGIYHQGNSRGAVANSDYVNRYYSTYNNTPYNNYTDCADCHYAANLDDAPFYGPGGGSHVVSPGIGGNGACVNSCHKSGTTMAKTMHSVATRSIPYLPTITVPVLNQSTIFKGTNVSITATVDFAYVYAFIDGAQYRIMSGNEIIKPWTPMSAVDGNFYGTHEPVISEIETNLTPGTYIVEVRGMSGGPAQNWSIPYYPMNGEISTTKNATLTIQAEMGYIKGTITSGGSNLSGATVSTIGASNITGPDGSYSLRVPEGTYDVAASKQPTHGENTTTAVLVTPSNTTTVDMSIDLKPVGTISGVVSNI